MLPTPNNSKVLVIGWDAADWRMIRPLMEQGKMPNLARMVQEGTHGNVSTLTPILSPMLWTSIATGKRAPKHGIWGFSEPTPDGKSIRPITNTNRRCKAVWNVLNQVGKTCNVVAFWPSHPAEPINGVMVSNWYQNPRPIKGWQGDPKTAKPEPGAHGWTEQQWAMPPGTVHPANMASNLQEFRVHPAELEAEQIAPFIPSFAELQEREDPRLLSCCKIISETASVHAAATALMQLAPADFTAVYFDGVDHFGHGFMKYHPPRHDWISEEDFEHFKHVVEAGYRFHDLMLGNMLALAGDDTTVFLLSDHGFHPDHLRPSHIPEEPAGPAVEHRPYGIFVAKGPGIRRGETITGASVLDLTPTVLHCFGLPVGEDMDGKVLNPLFEREQPIATVPSWDEIDGPEPDGMHPRDTQLDSLQSADVMKQLIELGYIEDPGDDTAEAVRETVRELSYNLAQAHMDAGQFDEALGLLEGLWDDWPREHRFGTKLIGCLGALGRWPERAQAIETLEQRAAAAAEWAASELKRLAPELTPYGVKIPGLVGDETADPDADAAPEPAPVAGQPERPKDMPKPLSRQLRKLNGLIRPLTATLEWMRIEQAIHTGHADAVLGRLKAMAGLARTAGSPELLNAIGNATMASNDHDNARQWFEQALAIDSENLDAHRGLAEVAVHAGDWAEAVDQALAATELRFQDPRAHYLLGRGLAGIGDAAHARTAFELAVRQAPGFTAARQALADLLEREGDTAGAAEQREQLDALARAAAVADDLDAVAREIRTTREARRGQSASARCAIDGADAITIVSGLPRSGTSMMMQMLAAGGLGAYTDQQRAADADNPRGYFEHERVKRLMVDDAWVPEARGQAVKVVSQLLAHLPRGERYRVVFMDRDLRAIVRSQRAMLERTGQSGARMRDAELMRAFDAQVAAVERLIARRDDMDVLFVDYDQVLADPKGVAGRLAAWLGGGCDAAAMAEAVDRGLRRQPAQQDAMTASA